MAASKEEGPEVDARKTCRANADAVAAFIHDSADDPPGLIAPAPLTRIPNRASTHRRKALQRKDLRQCTASCTTDRKRKGGAISYALNPPSRPNKILRRPALILLRNARK
jgi:hypothetical protein